MAVLLTSGNPLGLRALGSGGRTAVASYEQITRTLRQSLGPDHAALFAEPNRRAASIDWFTGLNPDEKPIRLIDAAGAAKQRGLAQLERLVRDIEAKAVSLQKSDRQDERILGDMLAHALEIPNEDAVFLVGDQPVMTFWGYVLDQGRPVVAPIHALLLRRTSDPLEPQTVSTRPPEASDASQPPRESKTRPAGDLGLRAWPWLVPAVLWSIFTLLLLTIGVELLRGCAIGLPSTLTGWFLNYCSRASDTEAGGALANEQAKQDQFKAEYDELLRQAALKRQACEMRPGSNEQQPIGTSPIPTPKPREPDHRDQMRLPDKKKGFAFIEGCWRAQEGLTATTSDGKDTGKKLKITYCFNKDGTGSRTIRYEEDGAKCVGSARASFANEILDIALGYAQCDPQHLSFRTATDACRRGDNGVAVCTETAEGGDKSNFKDTPFTRTNEEP